ncbi:alpha/beta hydrolase [Canibacter zhoujuaniae]|uniref:alpha/beta hydrolase n=1 Tax=Canibacter zhoujuaniae TaxID=2708343 RepID=UPI00141ED24B|nr:alpha/beta hydrolase [Canibacter zhoujuaniae]
MIGQDCAVVGALPNSAVIGYAVTNREELCRLTDRLYEAELQQRWAVDLLTGQRSVAIGELLEVHEREITSKIELFMHSIEQLASALEVFIDSVENLVARRLAAESGAAVELEIVEAMQISAEYRGAVAQLLAAVNAQDFGRIPAQIFPVQTNTGTRTATALARSENLSTSTETPLTLLLRALSDPGRAHREMGFSGTGLSEIKFKTELRALAQHLRNNPDANLLSLGRQNRQLVGAVAYGNLETAERIVLIVPGMGSNLAGIDNLGDAVRSLQAEERLSVAEASGCTSYVAWLGYDSPDLFEEPGMTRAQVGGVGLSRFLSDLASKNPQAQLTIVPHSYGTTVTAEALQHEGKQIAAVFTIGSAGLARGVKREQLRTERLLSATAEPNPKNWNAKNATREQTAESASDPQYWRRRQAPPADVIAPIGRTFGSHPTDPRNLADAPEINVNAWGDSNSVRSHSLYVGEVGGGYLDRGSPAVSAIIAEVHRNSKGAAPANTQTSDSSGRETESPQASLTARH